MTKFKTIRSGTGVLEEWENNKPKAPPSRNNRSKRTRANAPIYNEIFIKMSETLIDPFWKERFQEASEGIFPPNISYCAGVLQYKFEGESLLTLNTEVTDLESIKAEANRVIQFLQAKLQMYSPLDFKNFFESDLDNNDEEVGNVWSKIKPRQRTISLVEFMKSEKLKRNLNREQYLELEQLINVCRVLKYINSDTVDVEKHRILRQYFLLFDETTSRYIINPDVSKNTKFKPQKKKVKKIAQSYGQKWIEFQRNTLTQDASHGPLPHLRNYKFPPAANQGESETGSSEI